MKRKKKNADAGIIYDQTGMSQQALSQYIGAKRSTLTHHLAGTRLLLSEAGVKLIDLTVKLLRLPPPSMVPTPSAEEKGELQQAAAWCRTQCIPLQKKLETAQAETNKAIRLLQVVDILEKEEGEMTEARQRWYDGQRYTANYKLMKFGPYQQVLLQAKIAVLEREAEVYEGVSRI